jgi:ribosomal protein S18 acetylase RimI-like enzyme
MYTIRNGEVLDAMDLKEINEKCLAENYTFDIYFQHLNNWGKICFVAVGPGGENAKQIVGYVMCFMEAVGKQIIGHITSIAVLPEHRGKGIAT